MMCPRHKMFSKYIGKMHSRCGHGIYNNNIIYRVVQVLHFRKSLRICFSLMLNVRVMHAIYFFFYLKTIELLVENQNIVLIVRYDKED